MIDSQERSLKSSGNFVSQLRFEIVHFVTRFGNLFVLFYPNLHFIAIVVRSSVKAVRLARAQLHFP